MCKTVKSFRFEFLLTILRPFLILLHICSCYIFRCHKTIQSSNNYGGGLSEYIHLCPLHDQTSKLDCRFWGEDQSSSAAIVGEISRRNITSKAKLLWITSCLPKEMEGRPIKVYDEPDISMPSPGKCYRIYVIQSPRVSANYKKSSCNVCFLHNTLLQLQPI